MHINNCNINQNVVSVIEVFMGTEKGNMGQRDNNWISETQGRLQKGYGIWLDFNDGCSFYRMGIRFLWEREYWRHRVVGWKAQNLFLRAENYLG